MPLPRTPLAVALCDRSNRPNIRVANSGSIPGPVSRTRIAMASSVGRSAIVTRPPGGVNLTAFESRLPTTVSSACSSSVAAHSGGPS